MNGDYRESTTAHGDSANAYLNVSDDSCPVSGMVVFVLLTVGYVLCYNA